MKQRYLLIVFLVLAILSFDPRTFLGGDNATYILLAKSIASGHGYRDIWTPNCLDDGHVGGQGSQKGIPRPDAR
jgi:hypothetical protein